MVPQDLPRGAPPPSRLAAAGSALWIIDMQARLVPAIAQHASVVHRARVLLRAARRLQVPVCATEHCAASLGGTVPELAGDLPDDAILPKRHFSALAEPAATGVLARLGERTAVVAGAETHVCVLQTVLDLLRRGVGVAVVADALGSRAASDRTVALDRMARAGADVVTTEMVVFEWLESADHPAFRDLLALVKQPDPESP